MSTDASNSSTRFLSWNLRHGGGKRRAHIVLSLLSHKPDLVVLTEFHAATGGSIRGILADVGLTHQATSSVDGDSNSILIASRAPIQPSDPGPMFPAGPARMLDISAPDLGILVSGVHIPDDSRAPEKLACWHSLIDLARKRQEKSWMVMGDFNSGRHRLDEDGRSFKGTPLLGTFASLGMLDAWRHLHPESRERSWSHPARGATRIDACYLSKSLHKCLQNSHFSHAEREHKLSDHSALIVDLDLVQSSAEAADARATAARSRRVPTPELLFSAWKTGKIQG